MIKFEMFNFIKKILCKIKNHNYEDVSVIQSGLISIKCTTCGYETEYNLMPEIKKALDIYKNKLNKNIQTMDEIWRL